MPKDTFWENERKDGLVRHEVFFGRGKRELSIEDGLVIFITPRMHNMSDIGIHFNRDFDLYAKRIAERTWMEFYNKTEYDFIKRYGKSYL